MAGSWPLSVGSKRKFKYSKEDAHRVLGAFAFAKETRRWRPDRRVSVQPAVKKQYRWAYRTYDCVATTSVNLTVEDVAITAALNSRIDARTMLTIAAIAGDVSRCLKAAPTQKAFWQLTPTHLAQYRAGSPAAPLWEAWALLKCVVGADIAIPHKVLHRKRPDYFPLLDGNTVLAYEAHEAWAGICADLQANQRQFATLEEWFANEAQKYESKEGLKPDDLCRLKRLRIHDILLWAQTAGQLASLLAAGKSLGY